jgi:sensor histidine kinase YesM
MNADDEMVGTKTEGSQAVGSNAGTSAGLPFWKRPVIRVGFMCAAFFVIGAAAGSAITTHVIFRTVHGVLRDPERMAERMLEHMQDDFDLTQEQATAIHAILSESMGTISETMKNEHETMHQRVREVLTQEQRVIHDEKMKTARHRFFGGRAEHAGEPE